MRDEVLRDHTTGDLEPILGDRVFQVEDDGVGFVAFALNHLAFAVPGDEEKGAEGHTGFFRIRPERRQ